jgi:hypothetical protein
LFPKKKKLTIRLGHVGRQLGCFGLGRQKQYQLHFSRDFNQPFTALFSPSYNPGVEFCDLIIFGRIIVLVDFIHMMYITLAEYQVL